VVLPLRLRSHAIVGLSMIRVLMASSNPRFRILDRFTNCVAEAPSDGAIEREMSASRVSLL